MQIPAPVLCEMVDDGSTIAILGDVDHLHPDEITVSLSLDENVTILTLPNIDGAWSLTVQSSAEQFYLNITANHDIEETTSDPIFIESIEQLLKLRQRHWSLSKTPQFCPHITV